MLDNTMQRMIITLIGLLLLMSSSAMAVEEHLVVYSGDSEENVTTALQRISISGEFTFETIDSLTFPDPAGLWAIGPKDSWDCSSPMDARAIKGLIDEAIDATFQAQYDKGIKLIDQAMEFLACEPIDSLIGRAMFVRAMIACNSGQHIGEIHYGDSNRTMDFFVYANAADLALDWDDSFPPTCETINLRGEKETWEAKNNFDFAKQRVQDAKTEKTMQVPVFKILGDLEIEINVNGTVPTPSMINVAWNIGDTPHKRIIMLDTYQNLTLVAEKPWREIVLAGPVDDTRNEDVVKATFADRSEYAIDVVTMHEDESISVYTFYPTSEEVPFYVHPRRYPRSDDPPGRHGAAGALGIAGAYTLAGNSHYVGARLLGRIRIVSGLHLAFSGSLGVTNYKGHHLLLPTVDIGVRYQFIVKHARPFIGAQALVTFTNNPELSPIHVAGLACGGISIEVDEHILAPFIEACGGGGTLTGIVQISAGIAFQ